MKKFVTVRMLLNRQMTVMTSTLPIIARIETEP